MMKSLLKWGGVAALGLAMLAGCGAPPAEGDPAKGGDAPKTADGKKLKIGVSIPAADHGWTGGVVWWAEKTIKEHPEVDWVFKTAADATAQISDVETMMAQNIDGLVILAHESAPLTPVAKQAHEKGIYIVNVDRGFLEPVADVLLQGDNKAFGKISADFIVEKLGGKGNILVLEGVPCTVNTLRVDAAKEVWKANPGITVLDSQPGNWNQQKAFEVMQTLLLKHKQVDAIWAGDDDMALGAEKALKEAGRTDVKFILGGAGMKDIVKRVMDGDPMFPANVTYPPAMIKDGMDRILADLGSGKKRAEPFKQEEVTIKLDLITKENAEKFYFPDSIY